MDAETLQLMQQQARAKRALAGPSKYDAIDEVAQGLTLGYSDEMQSGLRALGTGAAGLGKEAYSAITGGETQFSQIPSRMGQAYEQSQQEQQIRRENYKKSNPVTSVIANVAGGLLTGGAATGSAIRSGGNVLTRMGKGSAVGGTTAGIEGFGEGSGFDDRTAQASDQFIIGATLGAVLPGAISLGGAAISRTADLIGAATPERRASEIVARGIQRQGMTPQEAISQVEEARAQNIPFALVDTGFNLRKQGMSVSSMPGEGQENIYKFLNERQANQEKRIIDKLVGTFGNDQTAFSLIDQINKTMRNQARPLYNKAYFDENGVERVLTDENTLNKFRDFSARPSFRRAYTEARELASEEGIQLPPSFDDFIEAPTVRSADYVARALWDMSGAQGAKGMSQSGKAIKGTRKEFLEAVDKEVPDFGKARAVWQQGMNSQETIELGTKFRSMGPDEIKATLQEMSEAERAYFRLGVQSRLTDDLSKVPEGSDSANVLTKNTAIKERLKAIFPEEAQFNDLMKFLTAEQGMVATRRAITQRSPTADIQQGQREVSGNLQISETPDFMGVTADALQGNFLSAGQRAAPSLGRKAAAGYNLMAEGAGQKTRAAVANLLTEQDPQKLAQMMRELDAQAALERLRSGRGSALQGAATYGISTNPGLLGERQR